jgi:hypothetical protein
MLQDSDSTGTRGAFRSRKFCEYLLVYLSLKWPIAILVHIIADYLQNAEQLQYTQGINRCPLWQEANS